VKASAHLSGPTERAILIGPDVGFGSLVVESTTPLVAIPASTRVSISAERITNSRSLPEKALTRRLVTTTSPSTGVTER
jgi:hypothetical protein